MKKLLTLCLALAMLFSITVLADEGADTYAKARASFCAGDLDGALELFEAIPSYEDSAKYTEYIGVIKLGFGGLYGPAESTIKNLYAALDCAEEYQTYFRALNLVENGDYLGATELLYKIITFFDAAEILEHIDALYVDSLYAEAREFIDAGDYGSAAELYTMMEDAEMVMETWYSKAEALREEGEFSAAAEVYSSIIGYRDSAEKYERMLAMEKIHTKYSIGSTVRFGRYPVSSILVDSAETLNEYDETVTINSYAYNTAPIEWTVLDVQDGKALLISRYAIDSQVYYGFTGDMTDDGGDIFGDNADEAGSAFVTWRTSYLRAWLNTAFLEKAFDASEYAMICTSDVKAEVNPRFRTEAGYDTRDKVYVLSISELEKYLPTNESRLCIPTDYAVVTRAAGINENGSCWYWTRCAGEGDKMAAVVLRDGSIGYSGRPVGDGHTAVRPVIWISIY